MSRLPLAKPQSSRPEFARKSLHRVGDFMGAMLSPALKARGFASIEVIARWDDLVGRQFAGRSRALQLKWPPRGAKSDPDTAPAGATLIIAVSGGAAIELQHLAPQIIERVNAMLGWACVSKLAFRQQPVAPRIVPSPRETPLTAAEQGRIEAATAMVEDEKLRHALQRLGKGVIQRNNVTRASGQ